MSTRQLENVEESGLKGQKRRLPNVIFNTNLCEGCRRPLTKEEIKDGVEYCDDCMDEIIENSDIPVWEC